VTLSRRVPNFLKIILADRATHPAAILFQPIGGTALPQVARAAAGIGWVVLNRDADYLPELRVASRAPMFSIGTDHREVGRIQSRQIAALLPGGGSVLYIQGPTASAAAAERTAGGILRAILACKVAEPGTIVFPELVNPPL
jgi:ABC-type sugar transport system substrate-binding protein